MPGSGRELEIRLYRDSLSTSWGFRLQGGKDLNAPLTIQKVSFYFSICKFIDFHFGGVLNYSFMGVFRSCELHQIGCNEV